MIEFRFNNATYRLLYPDILRSLAGEERADLEASIQARGIVVPVLVDEENGILDGMHRCLIAEAAGMTDIPVRVIAGLSEEEKRALAFEANDCRRQQTPHELIGRRRTRAEKRAAVAAAVITEPDLSNRAIAEKVKEKTGEKVDHKTVGKARGQLGNLDEIPQLPRTMGRDGKSRPARPEPAPPVTTDEPATGDEPEPAGATPVLNEPEKINRFLVDRAAAGLANLLDTMPEVISDLEFIIVNDEVDGYASLNDRFLIDLERFHREARERTSILLSRVWEVKSLLEAFKKSPPPASDGE